ncbi:MAG: copper chaperone PCu(A)C, partial [Pseudomonadales bacterium]
EPGGKHLMLMGPLQHLTRGQKVDMSLIFKSGKKQTVSVKVAAR